MSFYQPLVESLLLFIIPHRTIHAALAIIWRILNDHELKRSE